MRTEGINFIYTSSLASSNTQSVAFVDTAGTGEPLQLYSKIQLMRKELENYRALSKDKYNESEYKAIQEKLNQEEKKISDLKDELHESSVATENFLENFIMDECHIILVVVGILKNQDEKMINYISRLTEKKHASKPVIVVHNYY